MNRPALLADHTQVDSPDQLRAHRLGGAQRFLGLRPGGRIRPHQHRAADHGSQTGEGRAGDERNQPEQCEYDPARAGRNRELGGE